MLIFLGLSVPQRNSAFGKKTNRKNEPKPVRYESEPVVVYRNWRERFMKIESNRNK